MKNISITGYGVYYVPEKRYIVILGQKVKIYDLRFKYVKVFKEIKYAAHMAYDKENIYVGTTENYIYIISLETLEIVRVHQISLSEDAM